MRRGLDFTAQGLKINQQNKDEELSVSFTKGYSNTLKKYHSFIVKPVFTVRQTLLTLRDFLCDCLILRFLQLAMNACPYRAVFYPKLGPNPEKVEKDLKLWLEGLQKIVSRMQSFYTSGGYDKGL